MARLPPEGEVARRTGVPRLRRCRGAGLRGCREEWVRYGRRRVSTVRERFGRFAMRSQGTGAASPKPGDRSAREARPATDGAGKAP